MKSKKELVKKLLNNKNLEIDNYDELMNLLVDSSISVDNEEDNNLTLGERVADKLTEIAGSWTFIIGFIIFLILWIVLNIYAVLKFDAYPFILLNLILSCLASLQAPIIMMSQNRQAKKDSLRSKNDYKTDLKSELILEELYNKVNEIEKKQNKILAELEKNTDQN